MITSSAYTFFLAVVFMQIVPSYNRRRPQSRLNAPDALIARNTSTSEEEFQTLVSVNVVAYIEKVQNKSSKTALKLLIKHLCIFFYSDVVLLPSHSLHDSSLILCNEHKI